MHTSDRFRYSDHQLEMGKELFALAEQNGLEGILAKRTDSPYVSDRSPYWVKLKSTKTVDAVVGGWTAARTPALPFGSLLLGLYQGKKLQFIGHVGSGFDEKKLTELSGRLKELAASACPFDAVPETNEKPSWVSPRPGRAREIQRMDRRALPASPGFPPRFARMRGPRIASSKTK